MLIDETISIFVFGITFISTSTMSSFQRKLDRTEYIFLKSLNQEILWICVLRCKFFKLKSVCDTQFFHALMLANILDWLWLSLIVACIKVFSKVSLHQASQFALYEMKIVCAYFFFGFDLLRVIACIKILDVFIKNQILLLFLVTKLYRICRISILFLTKAIHSQLKLYCWFCASTGIKWRLWQMLLSFWLIGLHETKSGTVKLKPKNIYLTPIMH